MNLFLREIKDNNKTLIIWVIAIIIILYTSIIKFTGLQNGGQDIYNILRRIFLMFSYYKRRRICTHSYC